MDKFGNGKEIDLNRLTECTSPMSYANFNMEMFRQMCILSGCDYLSSISGFGLRKAHSLISIHKSATKVNFYFFFIIYFYFLFLFFIFIKFYVFIYLFIYYFYYFLFNIYFNLFIIYFIIYLLLN